MNVYIICPVRRAGERSEAELAFIDAHVRDLEELGHHVHYPPRDVDQTDPTGIQIVGAHRVAMLLCDEVHVFWDSESKGGHFDLGMAVVLGRKIVLVTSYNPDPQGKSYEKVIRHIESAGHL